MNQNRQKPPVPWPYIGIFFIIILIVLVLGYAYYKYQKDRTITEKENELSAIADLKVSQIEIWRKERLGDGNTIRDNAPFESQLTDYIKSGTSENREELLKWMTSLTVNFDYRSVLLLDKNLKVKLSVPAGDSITGANMRSFVPDLLKNHNVILSDLHTAAVVDFIHLDLLIPLFSINNIDTITDGILLIRIDPERILYPIVTSWPTPGRTSESLIVRLENDSVLYLNNLRHQDNTALRLKIPVSDEHLPAASAVKGIEGSVQGKDYRDVPVLASLRKIPGSPWFLIVKTDREELFAPLKTEMFRVLIIIFLFIVTIGSMIVLLWRNQKISYYRGKYEVELDRLALIKHFDFILKYANDIILLMDQDFVIIEANDRALETYQYSRNELIGMSVKKIRAPETLLLFKDHIRLIEEKGFATYETIHRRKDKTDFPIEISARVVSIEGEKYFQSIGRNITERKLVEATLKESEAKFRKIFEDSPLGMVMTGKDFRILRANTTFCKMIGYNEEELIDNTFREITHPDHISGDEISIMRLVKEDIPIYKTEKRYIHKDGIVFWASTTLSLIRDNNGNVQFFLAMVEDITSRRQAADEVERSFSLLKATLESTADGILVVDNSNKIVQYNHRFIEMWRIPDSIMSSGNDDDAIRFVMNQLKEPDRFFDDVKRVYENPELALFSLLEFSDGRFFERYSQPQKINGKSVGRVWSFRDITENKVAESNLIAAKEKAEESDKLKTAFLHNVSHEIRTPMNAIIGFSSLLNELNMSDPDCKQYTDIIYQSGTQLLSIINDIVDIANIESGQARLNISKININATLNILYEQFRINENNARLNLREDLFIKDHVVQTDGTKLIQVLANLLNNAIKFTGEGKIDFGYELKENWLTFFVKDTGIGIPQEYHERIFDRFYQVDSRGSRKYGGTGLGLSICKAYVELMGGKIWLNSVPEEGTTFCFTIPYLPVTVNMI